MKQDSLQKEVIEKPWAVYGAWLGEIGIGLLSEKPSNDSCYILYSEGQYYPPELWDTNYVHFFSKLSDATAYFLKNQCPVWEDPYSEKEILKGLQIHFPIAIKQEKQNELKSLVTLLSKLTSSESSVKNIINSRYKFGSCAGCIRQEKTC